MLEYDISSKENPKDGVRVRLLILNTFHKGTDLQIQDKTQSLAWETKHQNLFLVLIDVFDLRSIYKTMEEVCSRAYMFSGESNLNQLKLFA